MCRVALKLVLLFITGLFASDFFINFIANILKMVKKLKLLFVGLVVLLLVVCLVSVKAENDDQPSPAETEKQQQDDITKLDDDDDDDDDEAPEVPEGMNRENMVKWSAPDLSDEEAHSSRLPSNMKCDGCTAVAYQVG